MGRFCMSELHYQLDLLKAMNLNISAKEKMYRLACEKSDGAFLYFSFEKNEFHTFGKWKDFFEFDIAEKRDLEKLFEVVDEAYAIALREIIYLEKTEKENGFLECLSKDKKKWISFRTDVIYDANGCCTDKIITISNTTKNRLQTEELNYFAYYDVLTGLYNRNYFIRLLGEFLQRAEKEKEIVSVMMIDIDDFHKINDGLGMIAGDEVVQQLGGVLKELCDERIIACHLNSDVYCMAIYGNDDNASVEKIHHIISERQEKPFHLSDGPSINLTVTIGVAQYPEASESALELINCAEIVMLKCKSQGKNSILFFDTPIISDFLANVELETKLKEALSKKCFELYYQPQYYAGNKKLRGMEALIRWRDGDDRMISPALFIPIAEKNGSIVPLGNWIIDEAVRQYAEWRKEFHTNFILSINISARQYSRSNFVDNLLAVLDKYKVDPYLIELEVTESILIEDFEQVYEKLILLQQKGIRISLDDFGTGFSSLSYLKKLPINTLKIDKSFIDTVLSDSSTRIITESIVSMVKSLGFESVAEGVEQDQQFKYLHAIGCDVIQGYLLGKPMSAADVEQVLKEMSVR